MKDQKTIEEAIQRREDFDENLRNELREKIHDFTIECSRRFPMLGYEWIDIILAFFTDLKAEFSSDRKGIKRPYENRMMRFFQTYRECIEKKERKKRISPNGKTLKREGSRSPRCSKARTLAIDTKKHDNQEKEKESEEREDG